MSERLHYKDTDISMWKVALRTRRVLSSQRLQYKDAEFSEWMFELQTDSVLTVHNAYNTKIQKFQGGRFAMQAFVVSS